MPVLKRKKNGVWEDVSGMSAHIHTKNDITDLESALDELLQDSKDYTDNVANNKADSSHNHNSLYYTKEESDTSLAQKSQVQIITWEADD